MAAGKKADPLYGEVEEGVQRFDIAQDPRRMYPISAFGKLYGKEMVPNRLQSGSTGYFGEPVTNMIPVGDGTTLASIGHPEQISATIRAIRLGVTGTSGGDFTGTSDFSFVFANRLLSDPPINLYVMMSSGEAVYRDTNANADQYGAISEGFTEGALTWTGGAGVATITISASINALPLTTAYAYTPSNRFPGVADILRLEYDDGGWSYHRITSIDVAGTSIGIAPNTRAAGTAKDFHILRSGLRSMSRIVTVTDIGAGMFYNYYCGNAVSLTGTRPGTIHCWTQNTTGGSINHFMCPQTVDAAGSPIEDIKAKDIIYYKSYLLYGYGKSISWSVAGFPTSFTTGFGTTDFPALNTAIVANDDEFMSFEMLGDNVIALFKNSVWQVRATGTVPEFNFSRLIEPVGCFGNYLERVSCSARGRIYYKTTDGISELSGQIATKVSEPIRSMLTQPVLGNLSWEPTTDTLFINENSNSQLGWFYNVASQTWARLDLTKPGVLEPRCITGNIFTIRACMQAGFYDRLSNTIYFFDGRDGGPAASGTSGFGWRWGSPVISLGDAYDGFKLGAIQIEGDASIFDLAVRGGKVPTSITTRSFISSVSTAGNRIPIGKKLDDPFVSVTVVNGFVNGDYTPGKIYGANLYEEMRGR